MSTGPFTSGTENGSSSPEFPGARLPAARLVRRRCLAALGLLAALAFVAAFVLKWQANLLRSAVLAEQLSSRQQLRLNRMRTLLIPLMETRDPKQRMRWRTELSESSRIFLAQHGELHHGSQSTGLFLPPDDVREILETPPYDLDRKLKALIATLQALGDVPDAELALSHPTFRRFFEQVTNPNLLEGMETLATARHDETERRLRGLFATGYVCLAATFAGLVLMWFTAFAPMIQRVHGESYRQLIANRSLSRHADELRVEVAERAVMAEIRRQSERELRTIADALPALVSFIDTDLVYRFNNAAYATLFGRPLDQTTGRSLPELLSPPEFEQVRPYIDRVLNGETVHFEVQLPLFSGREASLRVVYVPRLDVHDQIIGFCEEITDVTEYKRTEAALRVSRERFRQVLDSALDAVVTLDRNGRITAWNSRAAQMFGWGEADALGKLVADLIVPPRLHTAPHQRLRRFLDARADTALPGRLELTALRRNGEEFPIELNLAPLALEQGFEFCGFIRDLSSNNLNDTATILITSEARIGDRVEMAGPV